MCLDRLELEANSLPQSGHFFLAYLVFRVASSKHFISISGMTRSELSEIAGEDEE